MRLFRRRQKSLTPGQVTTTPQFVEVLRLFDSPQAYDTVYRQLAPVRTVVDFLADAVATTSIKLYRRAASGRPEVRDHPLAVLLRNPNDETTPQALIGDTVRDIAVFGNAYWWKVGTADRQVWPIPACRVQARGGDLLAPASYDLYLGGAPVTVSRENMVHFKFYNPYDRRVGVSKLEALRTVLAEEVAGSEHRENFWKNAARRDGVIERPMDAPEWSDDDKKRFRAQWSERHTGSKGAGRTPVLEDGMKWNPDSFSPKDSEFVDGRKFILEATARVYNVAPQLLGLTQTATFASQKEFAKSLYQGTLPPWYQLIESTIELQLLPWFQEMPGETDLYVEFNVESKVRGSFEEQVQMLSTAIGRPWMEVAEGRSLVNLPDRGDPTDRELAIPTNNVTLGAPSNAELPKALLAFLDRQERSVLSKLGAGGDFDEERWNRELEQFIPSAAARKFNKQVSHALVRAGADTKAQRAVFDRIRSSALEAVG